VKTYWDLSERERSELERGQVEAFVAIELMRIGVVRARQPPTFVKPAPEVAKTTFYAVGPDHGGVMFATQEAAAAAVRSGMYVAERDWRQGSIEYFGSVGPTIRTVDLPSKATAEAHRSAFAEAQAAAEANEKAQRGYEEAVKKETEALAGMWSDWHTQRDEAAKNRRIVETFNEYLKLAGDAPTASAFLHKAFGRQAIRDAAEWFGETIPDPYEPTPEVPVIA
jgi:hypothetical protein